MSGKPMLKMKSQSLQGRKSKKQRKKSPGELQKLLYSSGLFAIFFIDTAESVGQAKTTKPTSITDAAAEPGALFLL